MTMEETGQEKHQSEYEHIPVMPDEVIEALNIQPSGYYVDATLGLGGHSELILRHLNKDGTLMAFDRDQDAINKAHQRLEQHLNQCVFVQEDFQHIGSVLDKQGIKQINGVIFDFGVSSLQLNQAERGFSFRHDGPLDMRMNTSDKLTAFDVVNTFSEQELSKIIRDLGQDRFHSRIARQIAQVRQRRPISTTHELVEVILKAVPSSRTRDSIHPATRTFQAVRIVVNHELDSIKQGLSSVLDYLAPCGRCVTIAFHSLEDRIVKETFRAFVRAGGFRLMTKKPLRPKDNEIQLNPRSRSAKVRVIERI